MLRRPVDAGVCGNDEDSYAVTLIATKGRIIRLRAEDKADIATIRK